MPTPKSYLYNDKALTENTPAAQSPLTPHPPLSPPKLTAETPFTLLVHEDSASLMSGTLESLSGLGEDGSSVGSDSEINGMAVRRTDKYGFLGGSQYSESAEKDVRVDVARQREVKWLDMFHNWDKWIKHRFQKVKLRCRKGIPSSLRAKAWQLLSNSQELLDANPGKFEELEREQGEAKWLDIIEKDLHRQFPFHEMFAARGGHGQQDLYRILKAYTIYRPDEGYCQAQAPVAAVLLMHMPAEQAFWCLVQICEKYLPGYYSAGLEAIQLDGEIFFSLLQRTCPMAYRHLKKFKIDPILYMTEWFMCIFSRTLPWASVLRVWDMFFCEGVKIVFRVGLVLLKQMLGSVDKLRELQGMYETMERLRNISPDTIREDILVQEIIILPVTEGLIERECRIQVRKWKESRGELTHQPGRRLHGTRAIFEYKRRAASISSGGSFSFLGSQIPPPGPLRASSSLLSLPGFRRSKKTSKSSQTQAEDRNASNVVEDVFIVVFNVVSVCLSSVVKCVSVLCVASLFSVSLWLQTIESEVVLPKFFCHWNKSEGDMEGCTPKKRGRKLRIQPDTIKLWLFFSDSFMCFFVSDKTTHREHFIVLIQLHFLCLRLIFAKSRHNIIDKLVA
uniref:TBC1 domain family, member 10b n=1 Tax=Sander lucioperca TaxID=283035 RepID=A0A8C9ZQV4_SANLU